MYKGSRNRSARNLIIYVKWEPQGTEFYKLNLNIDGSCLGNPSAGGIGKMFRDNNKKWVLGFNMGVQHATKDYFIWKL